MTRRRQGPARSHNAHARPDDQMGSMYPDTATSEKRVLKKQATKKRRERDKRGDNA